MQFRFVLASTVHLILIVQSLRLQQRQSPSNACSLLESYQSSATLFEQDGNAYLTQRNAHWSQTARKNPACIYSPRTREDVIRAVKILVSSNTTFAVRGGGHSPIPLWASTDGGVLISMGNINDKTYDPSTETVRVGFGSVWIDVFKFVEEYGRMVVGAREPTVGMGFLLGGGVSHLSNAYGFAVDNVVSYDIVLANGTAVTASATSHSELFFALKAGTNNYGIVTHATLRTYPLGKVWGGTIVYSNEYRDQLMRAFANYQATGQLDTKSALIAYLAVTNQTAFVTLYYLDAVERPAAFKYFYEIPALQDTTQMHDKFSDMMAGGMDLTKAVSRWVFAVTTFLLDAKLYEEVGRLAQNAGKRFSTVNGGTLTMMPQPISVSMVNASRERGKSPMNVIDRPQMWLTLIMGWNLESDDETVNKITTDLILEIEILTSGRYRFHPFIHMNHAHRSQDVFGQYTAESLRTMQAVRERYDPGDVFQRLVPGGFKLG